MPTIKSDILPAKDIYKDCKPGIRYYKLLKLLPELPEHTSSRPYIDEMDRGLSKMTDMRTRAKQLESQGKIEQAIALFTNLVEAQFDDPHPYFRLCEYYAKNQQPEQVHHISTCYIRMAETLTAMGFGHPYREELIRSFVELSTRQSLT